MHYLLRQVLSADADSQLPIEIHLRSDTVFVGRKQYRSLTRFPQISRKHAVFYKSDDGSIFVKDLDSTNGIYVNNTRIGSSLKHLKSGDVIGFGVSTSSTAVGFVCVLVNEDTDIEEIVNTDDDISSKTPVNRELDLNSSSVASHNNNVCLPDIYEVPSSSEHRERTDKTPREVERGESSSQSKNRGGCYDSNASESSDNGSISLPQTNIKKVQKKSVCRREEPISLQECFVRLVRCDDSSFQFPPGVKNPFKTGQIKLPLQATKLTKQSDRSMKIISHRKRKLSRKLNRDSSDDSDSAQSKTHGARYSVYNKHRLKRVRRLSTDSDDSDKYAGQSTSSKAQHSTHSVSDKHRRKQSRKLITDSSDDSDKYARQSTSSKEQHSIHSVSNKHRRKQSRKLITDSSDDSDKYARQSTSSKAQHSTHSVSNKHRRKQSRKLITDSSGDSDKYARQSTSTKAQHTTHSVNDKHRMKQSKKLSNGFPHGSEKHARQNVPSEASRNTYLLNNKHSQKQQKLSSGSSGDSDKNAGLVNFTHERKRRRNSSSVSSDCSGKIMFARTSAMTGVNAHALSSDEKDHDSRTRYDNQVNGKRSPLPRDPDLEQLNCKRSSSKIKGDSKSEAKSAKMCYSKPDVFYVSDGENYLDRKSSQDCVFRKEPEETGNTSSDSDTFKEVFGGENSSAPSPKTVVQEGHSDGKTESIETILKFIHEQKPHHDCAVRTKRSVLHQEAPVSNAFGEQSSEYDSDSSIRSNEKDRRDEVRNSRQTSPPTENTKGIRKSAGRTLLTEPKPLSYVARKFRGRDENFVEKKPQTQPSRGKTSRSESKSSKVDDYYPPPSTKKRISHLASKASTLSYNNSNLAPKDSSHPSQPSPVADVVKNRVSIESTESSQRNLSAENIASRPLPTKYAVTDHKRMSIEATVDDHLTFSARREGSNGVLRQLLQMNTSWLDEQAVIREPPPDVSRGAAELPFSFDSHESYTAMFRPLILLEIWERLFTEWREMEVDGERNCKFHFAVLGHNERGGCVELECESVLEDGRRGPRVGDIAVLIVKEGPPHNQCTPLFGYILGHSVKLLGPYDVLENTPWKHLSEDGKSSGDVLKRWVFRACVKRKKETSSFDHQSLMKGYNLGCVRNLLDCTDAFISIRDSPLLDTLLRPAQYTLPTSQRRPSVSQDNLSYTSEQEEFIRTVSDIVVRGAVEPEVFLLGGVPGTGKTHVIVGLIERLLYRRSAGDIRVLVAAPSDTAVDEIGRRLIKLARHYAKTSVRFVRVGHESQVDRQMVPYCASKMVRGVSVDVAEVLRRSSIVLSTLSGICAAHQLRPSLCIVDDASQCTEPEALQAVATGTALLVLAGDPQQRSLRVLSRKARICGLDRSLFERIMRSRPAHFLCEQFRMHSEIARYPCPSSFTSPRRPNDRISPLRPYLVLDLPSDEDSRAVAIVCEFVCKIDSLAAVAALVSPSSRRVRFRTEATPLLRRHARRVEVRGPEGFLGREKDVVVLWAELPCPLRLRAAITRARRCLIICVAAQKVTRANPFWAKLVQNAEERGLLCTAPPNPENLEKVLQRRLLLKPR